jgi:hypothetical protein
VAPRLNYGAFNQYTYYPFAGKIDWITMYDRALSSAEVQQIEAGTTTLQLLAEPTQACTTCRSSAAPR